MMSCCDGNEAAEVEKARVGDGKKVRWERLMPRMSLRVLLVEADESTRQVIAGLLRKCSYKGRLLRLSSTIDFLISSDKKPIVVAVSDGLTAWEVLKGRPKSIDLILAEVELPSISGFALLTLIMENDSCKNIPVIMISKNDSVNMVYKFMLSGAADFLVKPVRKNELQNLWQHVWRRQAVASGMQRVQDESNTQHKVEGLLDNDLLNNESNGACTPENNECNEKGNDAQNSCSVPDREAESAFDNMQDNSKSECHKLVMHITDNEHHSIEGRFAIDIPKDGVPQLKKPQEDCNLFDEASDNNDVLINGPKEAIDLIGTFQNHSNISCLKSTVINGIKENDSSQLDLSLRRHDDIPSHQDITADERRNVVHQSNASAFSRYKAIKPSTRPYGIEGSFNKHMPTPVSPSNFHITNSHSNTQMSPVGRNDLRQFSSPRRNMLPVAVQVQVNESRVDRTCTSYSYSYRSRSRSSLHPSYHNHTGASPTPSTDSAGRREVLSQVMHVPGANISNCSNQIAQRQDMDIDSMGHIKNTSSVNNRCQNSSLCNNGIVTHLNSLGGGSVCGSNGSSNPIEGISTREENTYRSMQREAALNKFRLKRKDRCFEKKVRYESRKKLAEQRPRLKGQFVRQTPTDP